MKLTYLILFLTVIICNEIVAEMIVSDNHEISLIDGSSEEKAESETIELEGEGEVDCLNDFHSSKISDASLFGSALINYIPIIINPYIEIHSPPPDFN